MTEDDKPKGAEIIMHPSVPRGAVLVPRVDLPTRGTARQERIAAFTFARRVGVNRDHGSFSLVDLEIAKIIEREWPALKAIMEE